MDLNPLDVLLGSVALSSNYPNGSNFLLHLTIQILLQMDFVSVMLSTSKLSH